MKLPVNNMTTESYFVSERFAFVQFCSQSILIQPLKDSFQIAQMLIIVFPCCNLEYIVYLVFQSVFVNGSLPDCRSR